MPVRAEAFLDIESSLADRLYSAWQKESRPLLRKIWSALEEGDTNAAIDLANGINLSSLVEKNAAYIDHLSQNAILFGATRVTPDPRLTSIPGGNFDDILESSQRLLHHAIKYNVEDWLRFTLLESIARYGLANPATNFTAPDGKLADYVLKYSPEQIRDYHGRWSAEGGGLKEMYARLSKPDGGFTYQPTTEDEPSKGYALSIYPDRSFAKPVKELTEDDVVNYAVKNIDLLENPDHYIGAWHDPESGKAFLDISVVSQDEQKAAELALKHDQIAYFDLGQGKSVTVNREATSGGAVTKGVNDGRGSATDITSSQWQEGARSGRADEALYQAHGQGTDARGEGAGTLEAGRGEEAVTKGGPGSGNFGHAGRPGEVGGSLSMGGSPHEPVHGAINVKHLPDSLGLRRGDMPQIRGGDMAEFAQWAERQGVAVTPGTAAAASLHPAQAEYNPKQVAQMVPEALASRLTVSRDNYVLDGTNRWVRLVQDDPDQQININRIDLPAREALQLMHRFPKAFRKQVGEVGATVVKWDESQHPRNPAGSEHGGEFTSGGGGETGVREHARLPAGEHRPTTEDIHAELKAQRVPLEEVTISFEDKKFKLGNVEYDYAGAVNLDSRHMTLYPNKLTMDSMPGVIAHEVMHVRFQTAWDAIRAETARMKDDKRDIMRPDGSIRDGTKPADKGQDYTGDYPAHTIGFEVALGNLRESDGVTDYSEKWWKEVEKDVSVSFNAIHETLAEMHRLKFEHGDIKHTKEWESLYRSTNRIYAKVTGRPVQRIGRGRQAKIREEERYQTEAALAAELIRQTKVVNPLFQELQQSEIARLQKADIEPMVFWFDEDWNVVDEQDAVIGKVVFPDGSNAFILPVKSIAKWDEAAHPREPAGTPGGGQFASADAPEGHRDQFRNAMYAREGIEGLSYAQMVEKLGEERLHAAFDEVRTLERTWQKQMARSLSMGTISIRDALSKGAQDTYIDIEKDIKPLPAELYHVTTDVDSVIRDGLKTRDELKQSLGKGLGGGTSNTISFTTDREIADQIKDAMHLVHDLLNDKVSVQELVDKATKGEGTNRPFIKEIADSWGGALNDQGVPLEMDAAMRGRKVSFVGPFQDNYPPNTAVDAPDRVERTLAHLGQGWQHEGNNFYSRKASEAEVNDMKMQFVKKYLFFREHAGGSLDPLFFMTDENAFKVAPRDSIQTLQVKAKEGTRGYKVSALGEWRAMTGDVVDEIRVVGRKMELIWKYDENQPRDEKGRWTSLGAMLGAIPTKDDPNLRAEATTVTGRHVLLGPKFYAHSEAHQKEILTHEAAHFHGMDDWYLASHEDWDLAAKTKHGNLNGQTTPGEIIVEAYSLLWHDPEFLKANAPDLIPLVERGAEARNLPLPKHVKKYEDDQPREPKGSPEGGQWSKQVRAGELGTGMTFNMETKLWEHPTKKLSERDQQRLRERVTPPGWVNVHLNPDETAPLQVLGQDAAERWQPRYSAKHTKESAMAKFARGRDYNEIAPQVAATIERDMANPDKVNEAAAMRLIQLTGIRIGGDKGKGVKHTAIGASNLMGQHVKIDGDKITLSFTGKSAVRQHMTVNDPLLASYLRGRGLVKGRLVFDTTDAKMREYFKTTAGDEFKVKDVRMWRGTAEAIKELKKVRQPKNEKEFKEMAKQVATKVSKVLGNTPKMAMTSYIDPLVWQPWNEKFPGALEPKKRVKKSDIDDLQALLDEFYELVSFDGPLPDWHEFPETGLDPDDSEEDERRVIELDDDPLDLRKQVKFSDISVSEKKGEVEQKAETSPYELGRQVGAQLVRPFVSFRESANSEAEKMLQLVSGLHTSRLSAFGFTVEAEVTGVTTYAISAQLDNRVCPVCVLEGQRVAFNPGDTTAVSKRLYKGPAVTLELSSGQKLTVTPNHPVLTRRGWVAAGRLNEGDDIVCGSGAESEGLEKPQNVYREARVEEVFEAFSFVRGACFGKVPVAPEYFHGDGFGEEVTIVGADNVLRNNFYSRFVEACNQLPFFRALLEVGAGKQEFAAAFGHVGSGGGGAGNSFQFLRSGNNHVEVDPSLSDSFALQHLIKTVSASDFGYTNDFFYRNLGEVKFNRLVHKSVRVLEGHVYNLSTKLKFYLAEGIVVHNCEYMHGKEFQVEDAQDALSDILKTDDPDNLRTLQPWPGQSKQDVSEMMEMTDEELIDRNWHVPPFHPQCRCLLVKVEDVHDVTRTPSWQAAHPEMDSVFTNQAVLDEALSLDDAIRIRTLLAGETGPKTKRIWNELKDTYDTEVLEALMGTKDYFVQSGGITFPYEG